MLLQLGQTEERSDGAGTGLESHSSQSNMLSVAFNESWTFETLQQICSLRYSSIAKEDLNVKEKKSRG